MSQETQPSATEQPTHSAEYCRADNHQALSAVLFLAGAATLEVTINMSRPPIEHLLIVIAGAVALVRGLRGVNRNTKEMELHAPNSAEPPLNQ